MAKEEKRISARDLLIAGFVYGDGLLPVEKG
jgi:hypothetical protein